MGLSDSRPAPDRHSFISSSKLCTGLPPTIIPDTESVARSRYVQQDLHSEGASDGVVCTRIELPSAAVSSDDVDRPMQLVCCPTVARQYLHVVQRWRWWWWGIPSLHARPHRRQTSLRLRCPVKWAHRPDPHAALAVIRGRPAQRERDAGGGSTLGSTSGHSIVLAVRWLRGPSAWGVWAVASRASRQRWWVVILDAGNHSTIWKRNESHRVHRAVPDVTRLETQAKFVGIAMKVTSELRIA